MFGPCQLPAVGGQFSIRMNCSTSSLSPLTQSKIRYFLCKSRGNAASEKVSFVIPQPETAALPLSHLRLLA